MELRDLRIGEGINPTLIEALGGEERIRMAMRLAIHAAENRFSFTFPATVENVSLLAKHTDAGNGGLQVAGRILPPSEIIFRDKNGARYVTQCWTRADLSVRLRTKRI